MSKEADQLVAAVLESDEFDTKEISGAPAEDMLREAGFVQENGVWVKRMAKQAITVAKIPNGFFSIGYFQRGIEGWIPTHREGGGDDAVASMVHDFRHVPVHESNGWRRVGTEDVDVNGVTTLLRQINEVSDDDFDMKDVYAGDYKNDILAYVDRGVLSLSGRVTRHSNHYVHESSTSFDISEYWEWPDDVADEERVEVETRIGKLLNNFEEEVTEKMRGWNKKIYRELETAYEWSTSEEVVGENMMANHYTFDEDGHRDNHATLLYNQLNDRAQQRAREWYISALDSNDSQYMAEPVILEWKWLLKNKGFDGVEINWSGFWNQGDGASFTAESLDFKRYVNGPDPLEFPEQDREQLSEAYGSSGPRIRGEYWITDDGVWFADGDVGDMNHEMYARDSCVRKVLDFFHAESDEEFIDETMFRDAIIEALEEDGVAADDKTWKQAGVEFIQRHAPEDTTMVALFHCACGDGDARDVAVKYFGWIWCRGNNLSTWTYDRSSILSGISEIIEQEGGFDDPEQDWSKLDLEIFVASTKRRYSITYGDLESGRTPGHDPTWPVAESEDDTKDVLGQPPPDPTFQVTSSHGEFTVRLDDGKVLNADLYSSGEDEDTDMMRNIDRFDVGEWRSSWEETLEPGSSVDILDLGYWFKNGTYEPPVEEWRNEFAIQRHRRGKPPQSEPPVQEDIEDDEKDSADAKAVYDVNRQPIKHIQTKTDYAEYEARVNDFFEREGINNLSSVTGEDGHVEQNEFSWRPCECCGRPLGGLRVKATGHNPTTGEVQEYWICQDCEYYAAYGQLDDSTMMSLKDNE